MSRLLTITILAGIIASLSPAAQNPDIDRRVDRWVVVTGSAAGEGKSATEKAVNNALRKAVEQACGVFLTARSETENYKAVYDKIIADAVGYVVEHEIVKTWTDTDTDMTYATVKARVSTKKFERDWAAIAHTVERENNPRIIVAVVEALQHTANGPVYEVKKAGIVQTELEDFMLKKGLTLMDRETAEKVSKRDVLLAVLEDDTNAVAALGAKFNADVVLIGRASAKYSRRLEVSDVTMYQHTASLRVRVVQTDSGRILASKSYGPATTNSLQRTGGGQKALSKIAKESAPKILSAVVTAWAQRASISRDVQLIISGMDYATWKKFRTEAADIEGVRAVRLREITGGTASVTVEWRHNTEQLADALGELESVHLKITEITANRLKLKVGEQ